MNRWQRVALAILLIVALFGLGSYAEATEEARWEYPTTEELGVDYEASVGQDALVFGTVQSVEGDSARILVTDDGVAVPLRVTHFEAPVRPGGVVQVYGTLREERTISPHRITVVNATAGSNRYKYAISGIAVAFFLAVFFREWRVDVSTLTVRRRTGLEGREDG